jgi:hypothetical protein
MRRLSRLLPLVLLAALAGCGQTQSSANEFEGPKKAVAQKIEDLQTAAQSRKPGKICTDILSRELADKVKSAGDDCVREMEKISGDADDYELKVTAVTVTGTTATARVETRRGQVKNATVTYRLTREDGAWRLADLGS